ncbi:MAG: cyclic dehypoxanthinyl futalosine synthase [Candidatus Dormibacteria bacterium]
MSPSLASVLDRAAGGGRISPEEGVRVLRDAPFMELALAADARARALHPERTATFQVDRNINYTNACVTDCSFCAFYRPPGHPESYVLSYEQVLQKVDDAVARQATSLLMQGGHNPELRLPYYTGLFAAIRARHPEMHLHCLSPSEVTFIAELEKMTVTEVLRELQAAGLDSIPGGGAEILDDAVRHQVSPKKIPVAQWLEVMRSAHRLGLPTTATMMMGSVETLEQRVHHLEQLRSLQDEALAGAVLGPRHEHIPPGFFAFIAWSYQPDHTALGGERTSGLDYLRTMALSRLFLDNIAHLQASWLTMGHKVGQLALSMGTDDLGSVMLEENVVRLAGARYRNSVDRLVRFIHGAERAAVRRDTYYRVLETYPVPEQLHDTPSATGLRRATEVSAASSGAV